MVTVELQRESVVGFVKLVAGVYAAIAIALLSFLMAPEHGRMTVLVGALFATVINMQVDYDSGREARARRRDLVSLFVFGASFLVINAILIVLAATSG